jgi:hypothetical protein
MRTRTFSALVTLVLFGVASVAFAKESIKLPKPIYTKAVAVDLSKPVRNLAPLSRLAARSAANNGLGLKEVRPERELGDVDDHGFSGDGAVQRSLRSSLNAAAAGNAAGLASPTVSAPLLTFEGVSNQDNFNIYGGRVNPPDPNGAVGKNHIVEMANLTFAIYDKATGNRIGPVHAIGDLWAGFAVPDCDDTSGDPVVLYDRYADRWILSQFTTSGMNPDGSYNGLHFFNCVAISQTGDPTGAYYRYAFDTTEPNGTLYFPDYPKYGVWSDSYLLTSRDFGPTVQYGISVYALEKSRMMVGDPNARSVKFFLDSDIVPLNLIGDGLLPADLDATNGTPGPAPIVGTQDDGFVYGAPSDALNIWELAVQWKKSSVTASIKFAAQLPVASFDSVFPCTAGTGNRSCIPEPGVPNNRWLDSLSRRQRPTFRLAFRKLDNDTQTMVTNQSVEASPGVAGVRWYEIRRKEGVYSLYQQGTFNPDSVNRWMGSIAMDKKGNIALGYSVSDAVSVKPGIRYTGRLAGDPLGQMTLGEATLIDGTGVQLTTNNRWGDYTSLNLDPDGCRFWYTNEYYQIDGIIGVNTAPWQTRIGSFKLPGCN